MAADLFHATIGGGSEIVAGVDEAGRGPLAGPVVAAAVVLDARRPIAGLADSKQLRPSRREGLAAEIKRRARAWALGSAEVEEIDRINILAAALLAMRRAVLALNIRPDAAWIDGNVAPPLPCATVTVVGGDASVASIAAASILAKTARDAEMAALAARHPQYGFERHKGYGTQRHLDALRQHGPSIIHRRSFAPVQALLGANSQLELPSGGREALATGMAPS